LLVRICFNLTHNAHDSSPTPDVTQY
jgi:hypothetical protein